MKQAKSTNKTTAELLKEAATVLFGKYGYEGTSVRLIAANAGVSAGQITKLFGSKENLFNEIVMDIYSSACKDYEPIIGEYEYLKRAGLCTEEAVWGLIERIIDMQISFTFDQERTNRTQIIKVQTLNHEMMRTSARLVSLTKDKIENTLAELFREVFKQKRRLHCVSISRAVNGAIVSFSEHPDLLLDEVLTSEYMPQSKQWLQEYIKDYIMDSLRLEAQRE